MKPEITPSLKARFFARYYGQNVMADKQRPDKTFPIDIAAVYSERMYLKLRPISGITDDEAIEIAKIWRPGKGEVGYNRQFHTAKHGRYITDGLDNMLGNISTFLLLIDHLRSIGIAIPFMGYSVEELVSIGWVRLIGL